MDETSKPHSVPPALDRSSLQTDGAVSDTAEQMTDRDLFDSIDRKKQFLDTSAKVLPDGGVKVRARIKQQIDELILRELKRKRKEVVDLNRRARQVAAKGTAFVAEPQGKEGLDAVATSLAKGTMPLVDVVDTADTASSTLLYLQAFDSISSEDKALLHSFFCAHPDLILPSPSLHPRFNEAALDTMLKVLKFVIAHDIDPLSWEQKALLLDYLQAVQDFRCSGPWLEGVIKHMEYQHPPFNAKALAKREKDLLERRAVLVNLIDGATTELANLDVDIARVDALQKSCIDVDVDTCKALSLRSIFKV